MIFFFTRNLLENATIKEPIYNIAKTGKNFSSIIVVDIIKPEKEMNPNEKPNK